MLTLLNLYTNIILIEGPQIPDILFLHPDDLFAVHVLISAGFLAFCFYLQDPDEWNKTIKKFLKGGRDNDDNEL